MQTELNGEYLQRIATEIHKNAKNKGFYDKPRNTGEILMLVVSELGEALEAHRKDRFANWAAFDRMASQISVIDTEQKAFVYAFENEIKDTFGDELADAVIRLLDFSAYSGMDISDHKCFLYDAKDNVGESLFIATGHIKEIFYSLNFLSKLSTSHRIILTISLLSSIAEKNDVDLIRHIELKMKYNATRERLHGKQY